MEVLIIKRAKSGTGICKEAKYWEDRDYHQYIEEHGEHFSEKLAKHATASLVNCDGTVGAHWTCKEVRETCKTLGYEIPKGMEYDIYYAANHIYSDHFGVNASLRTDKDVFKHVFETVNDEDGYPCAIFAMWLTKAMYKCWSINWGKMI